MNSITNKTEAYDYLYDMFQNNVVRNDDLFEQAKTFFTCQELECLNFEHAISINSCFPVTAKTCGCEVK